MIAVIDYGAGNTQSVMYALDRLEAKYILTKKESEIRSADQVIFPGVGHANAAMIALERSHLVPIIRELSQPFLGICLGMQLLHENSEEGPTKMINLIPGEVNLLTKSAEIKIPHMGWNTVEIRNEHPLIVGIEPSTYFYFVHSYAAPVNSYTVGMTSYGPNQFATIIAKDNYMGTQFHPEKSGPQGLKLLSNFLNIKNT